MSDTNKARYQADDLDDTILRGFDVSKEILVAEPDPRIDTIIDLLRQILARLDQLTRMPHI